MTDLPLPTPGEQPAHLPRPRPRRWVPITIAAAVVALTACGDDDETNPDQSVCAMVDEAASLDGEQLIGWARRLIVHVEQSSDQAIIDSGRAVVAAVLDDPDTLAGPLDTLRSSCATLGD